MKTRMKSFDVVSKGKVLTNHLLYNPYPVEHELTCILECTMDKLCFGVNLYPNPSTDTSWLCQHLSYQASIPEVNTLDDQDTKTFYWNILHEDT